MKSRVLSSFVKASKHLNTISKIKAIKTPIIDYIEPKKWDFSFDKPSQVKAKAFVDLPGDLLGPAKFVGKLDQCDYKNPEYYSYHTYSFYDMEGDLYNKRCRPQPSPFRQEPLHNIADEKSP